jgi:hypothetical protein
VSVFVTDLVSQSQPKARRESIFFSIFFKCLQPLLGRDFGVFWNRKNPVIAG